MKNCLLALVLSALFCAPALAEQLIPYDSTSKAPHFTPFREQLEKAVDERDAAFFRDRSKGASFGFATETLDQKFDLSDPNSDFWSIMERMLELGGSWQADSEMVVYPYAYADFPKSIEAQTHDVVTHEDVPLHNSSDAASFQVGKLSYEIVWVLERGEEWSRVRAKNGVSGWIENQYLYSPTGYRLGLALMDGRWAIVYFVGGR
jgi:hypothetical protein